MTTTVDQAQALSIHNIFRQDAINNHGSHSSPLVWDSNLVGQAQLWADHMAEIDQLVDADAGTRRGAGENIFSTRTGGSLTYAAEIWCSEINNYSGQPIGTGDFTKYGHYTQAVWPTTTNMGMASAVAASGTYYVCARYSPPGNANGQFVWGPIDGVYLVNAYSSNDSFSAFAYYSHIGPANTGHGPSAAMIISIHNVVHWEGQTYTAKFFDGDTFSCAVNANGESLAVGALAGRAQNDKRTFFIYKDDNRVLYENGGYAFHAVYKCT